MNKLLLEIILNLLRGRDPQVLGVSPSLEVPFSVADVTVGIALSGLPTANTMSPSRAAIRIALASVLYSGIKKRLIR